MRPSAQPIRPLPGYLNHLQELFLQAAKLLEPDHRARVEAAISGVDHARVERAMEQLLGLSLAAEAACPVYETEVVKPLIAAPESHDEVFRRLFALRDTFDTSETAEIDAFECGELEIPYAIRTRSEALAFARSEVVGALLAGSSPLIQHYHPKERSLVVSSPVVAVLAARFALGLEALAQGALLIGLARRVELLGIELEGSYLVGDTARDVLAARGTPLRTVYVHSGKPPQKELTKLREAHMTPTVEAMDLAAATDWILRDRRGEE
jgi:hypothetical protein